jgi:hypothetical protein
MVQGILRWYVGEANAADLRRDIFDKLNELGIQGNPWSSRTATLVFPGNARDAKATFNRLNQWLNDRSSASTPEMPFRCILCATLPNAYRSY